MTEQDVVGGAIPVVRGCGVRNRGGIHAEVAQSQNGRRIEDFLFDPPVLLPDGLEVPTRGVLPVERDGVWHLFDRIGMQHYPNVADYIEESRRWGISRRLSINVPFDKLTPASRLILVHDRAYVANTLAYGFWRCPKGLVEHDIDANIPGVVCVGVWWEDLDPRHASPGQVGRDVERVMPSFSYRARITPQSLLPDRRAGIFASFPISRLVVVRGNAHEEGLSAARKSKLPVCEVDQ